MRKLHHIKAHRKDTGFFKDIKYLIDGYCTEFNIYYFISYLFSAINDSGIK